MTGSATLRRARITGALLAALAPASASGGPDPLVALVEARAKSALDPVVEPTPRPAVDHATLASLIAAAREEPVSEGDLIAGQRLVFGPELGPLREALLVGQRAPNACRWHLAFRGERGWFGLDEGIAFHNGPCLTPVGQGMGSYPVAIRAEPDGLVVEVARVGALDGPPSERQLIRCRLEVAGVACADGDVPPSRIGLDESSDWHGPGLLPPALGERVIRVSFAGGVLSLHHARRELDARWTGPSGEQVVTALSRLDNFTPPLDVQVTSEAEGVVRVRSVLEEAGPDFTLTTAWDDLFVPPTASRGPLHVRLVTRVDGRSRTERAGWRREVVISRAGVVLREVHGPLAWFRATGRWTWDELAERVPRWRHQAAMAIVAEEARLGPAPSRRRRVHVTLELLPGYFEPLRRDLFDDVASWPTRLR